MIDMEELRNDLTDRLILRQYRRSHPETKASDMLSESRLNLRDPSKTTTWFIIFAILIFIGVLATVFFFTWQSQVKAASRFQEKLEEEEFPELNPAEEDKPKDSSNDG